MSGGVKVKIEGVANLTTSDYSVVEDSTPIDPSDSTGGVGQITFKLRETPDSKLYRGKQIELVDGAQGTVNGTIVQPSGDGLTATFSADTRASAFNATRSALPVTSTLGGALSYYFAMVGIFTDVTIDPSIASRPVVYPGWEGTVWDQLRKICAAETIEIATVGDTIVVRPIRTRDAITFRNTSLTWTIDDSNIAQSVDLNYYNNTARTNYIAFPDGGWNPDVPVITVDAGETVVQHYDLNASLSSITQPTLVAFVDRYLTTSSRYSVTGNDGIAIQPAQWTAGGGKLTVAISDDTRGIDVTVVGSTETQYAPYRIAVSAGPSDWYSSLRVIGTGVFFDEQTINFQTGASAAKTAVEVGATVENEFIGSAEQAYRVAPYAVGRYAGPRYTISVNTRGINRLGDSGEVEYPTVGDFDAANSGTLAAWNTANAGKTIAQWNAEQLASVRGRFENQAFGNIGGARVLHDDAMFRIRSGTATQTGVGYSAELDTSVADFNAAWAGKTVAQFNAAKQSRSVADWNIRPLSLV